MTLSGIILITTAALAVSSAACRNDAITYAHGLAPEAACNAIDTNYSGHGQDTAVCRFDGWVWLCVSGYAPDCKQVRRLSVEVKP